MITRELCETLGLTKISENTLWWLADAPQMVRHIEIRFGTVQVYIKSNIYNDWCFLAELPEIYDRTLILTQLKLALSS